MTLRWASCWPILSSIPHQQVASCWLLLHAICRWPLLASSAPHLTRRWPRVGLFSPPQPHADGLSLTSSTPHPTSRWPRVGFSSSPYAGGLCWPPRAPHPIRRRPRVSCWPPLSTHTARRLPLVGLLCTTSYLRVASFWHLLCICCLMIAKSVAAHSCRNGSWPGAQPGANVPFRLLRSEQFLRRGTFSSGGTAA